MVFNLFTRKNAVEKKAGETVIFIHIPKCAGTTLTQGIIKKIFPRRQRLIFYDGDTRALMTLLQGMPANRKEQLHCIAGHFAFGIHQFLPQRTRYITLLREPVERVVSHFYFARRNRRHYLHRQVRADSISLQDYVEKLENIEMDNGQTRILAGIGQGAGFGRCTRQMLDTAQENLRTHFAVIGISERFDDFLRLVHHQLGWSIPCFTAHNVGHDRPQVAELDTETHAVVVEHNQLDIELYRFAAELFERQMKNIL